MSGDKRNIAIEYNEIICPMCKTKAEILVYRFFSPKNTPKLVDCLLSGDLGTYTCLNCGFKGVVSMPMIYHDPSYDLQVYVCDEDRDTLDLEFHALLDLCLINKEITIEEYQHIKERPFQIVVGYNMLVQIVYALKNNFYCYRTTPGLDTTPILNDELFRIVAKAYRLAGMNKEAYLTILAAKPYKYNSPIFLQEMGTYALSAGDLDAAENYLEQAKIEKKNRSHLWQQIVPSQGTITSVPEEVALPKLSKKIEKTYKSMRAEWSLSEEENAALGGTLIGIMKRALEDLGEQSEIRFFLEIVKFEVYTSLEKKQPSERDRLLQISLQACWYHREGQHLRAVIKKSRTKKDDNISEGQDQDK